MLSFLGPLPSHGLLRSATYRSGTLPCCKNGERTSDGAGFGQARAPRTTTVSKPTRRCLTPPLSIDQLAPIDASHPSMHTHTSHRQAPRRHIHRLRTRRRLYTDPPTHTSTSTRPCSGESSMEEERHEVRASERESIDRSTALLLRPPGPLINRSTHPIPSHSTPPPRSSSSARAWRGWRRRGGCGWSTASSAWWCWRAGM